MVAFWKKRCGMPSPVFRKSCFEVSDMVGGALPVLHGTGTTRACMNCWPCDFLVHVVVLSGKIMFHVFDDSLLICLQNRTPMLSSFSWGRSQNIWKRKTCAQSSRSLAKSSISPSSETRSPAYIAVRKRSACTCFGLGKCGGGGRGAWGCRLQPT